MLRKLTYLAQISALCAVAHGWLPDGTKALMTSRGLEMVVPEAAERVSACTQTAAPSAERRQHESHRRWTPGRVPLRGVNLGSQFIIEPWLNSAEWAAMGCDGAPSEFDCVMRLGRDNADAVFKKHWEEWIQESDFNEMLDAGLNTVRIPIGYWMYDAIVDSASEYFPRGGLEHLLRVCGWASDRGFYIFLE